MELMLFYPAQVPTGRFLGPWRNLFCLGLVLCLGSTYQNLVINRCFFGVSAFGLSAIPSKAWTTTESIESANRIGLFGRDNLPKRRKSTSSQSLSRVCSSPNDDTDTKRPEAFQLKRDLLTALSNLKDAQARDGDFSNVDWGTKGGELTETGRVPKQVDYNMISPAVGKAAQAVLDLCDQLQATMPSNVVPTQYLGDRERGDQAPLNGAWKLLFSNAADAVFSKDSKRGAARAQNVVNAKKGRITNVIDFEPTTDSKTGQVKQPTLKQLNIAIKAKALNESRVELNFQYAKVVLTKFFFFPLFGRTLSLYIPVPATFVTQVIELCKTVGRFLGLKKKNADQNEKRTTKGYFDVLYLDDQLRVHRTGQGNIFVQAKHDWEEAIPLMR